MRDRNRNMRFRNKKTTLKSADREIEPEELINKQNLNDEPIPNILKDELGVPDDWKSPGRPPEAQYVNPDLDPNDPEDMKKIEDEANRVWQDKKKEDERATVDTTDKYKTRIATEDEMVKFFEQDEAYDLKVVWDDTLFEFKVKPLEAGDNIDVLNIDMDMLSDMDMPTREALSNKAQGMDLTAKEQELVNAVERKAIPQNSNSIITMANKLLATYVTPPEFNKINNEKKRLKARRDWWSARPFSFKMFLMGQVLKLIGMDTTATFKLFRPS